MLAAGVGRAHPREVWESAASEKGERCPSSTFGGEKKEKDRWGMKESIGHAMQRRDRAIAS